MIVFRLIRNAVLLVAWPIWAVVKFSVSFPALVIVLGLCAVAMANRWAEEEALGGIAFVFFMWNRFGAKQKFEAPPSMVPLFVPRAAKPAKPQPVPVVRGIAATGNAPTVRQALGRLSPALRDVIANPPPRDPA